jgi:replication fork clamp-binding protein CrfC
MMEELIPVINKLQDVFSVMGSNSEIDLPQIAVVGSQSSGKSSVLENIVGREFLPRGSGIVTRRPLVLQLNRIPKTGDRVEEWGVFGHRPDVKFTDFRQIRDEITRETDRLTGTNKGVSTIPISLKIYSPNVLNLTLIDLPGMTRVPVGEQPPDIEQQIRNMIMGYIKKENTIMVAVSPANSDLANSDALQLAREVDPDGNRTLGVITKIDIMDQGTDAMEILEGKVIPLRLGFIGIVNRSQQDIIKNKPIKEALDQERNFFQNHSVYRSVANKQGTDYLAKRLNIILLDHIRSNLPSIKDKVNTLYNETEAEMKAYGNSLFNEDKGALLLSIITNFTNKFKDAIDGKITDLNEKELYGGARINYVYMDIFAKCINAMEPLDGLTTNDIRSAIRNATGPKNVIFIPEVAFELLVKKQISRLEEPSMQCIEYVYNELNRIVNQVSENNTKELDRFTSLREKLIGVISDILQTNKMKTVNMIVDFLNIEQAYINTAHPDFIGTGGAINSATEAIVEQRVKEREKEIIAEHEQKKAINKEVNNATNQAIGKKRDDHSNPNTNAKQEDKSVVNNLDWASLMLNNQGKDEKKKKKRTKKDTGKKQEIPDLNNVPRSIRLDGNLKEKDEFETELIRKLLVSYFNIVRKNILDTIPKCIMYYLVNNSKNEMQNTIVTKLYKEDLLDDLLSEAPEIVEKRKRTRMKLKRLKNAKDILTQVREFNIKY